MYVFVLISCSLDGIYRYITLTHDKTCNIYIYIIINSIYIYLWLSFWYNYMWYELYYNHFWNFHRPLIFIYNDQVDVHIDIVYCLDQTVKLLLNSEICLLALLAHSLVLQRCSLQILIFFIIIITVIIFN